MQEINGVSVLGTGDLSETIGIQVSEELLKKAGFEAFHKDKRARFYKVSDYPAICEAIGRLIASRKDADLKAKPKRPPKETKPSATVTPITAAKKPAVQLADDL